MSKGWFNHSREHKLARLGIKTGRQVRRKTGSILPLKDGSMFYPKSKGSMVKMEKDTEEMTLEQPLTIVKETSEIATGKPLGSKSHNPKPSKKRNPKRRGKIMSRQSEKMTIEAPITIVKGLGEIATGK